jgi:hypothetical protein
MAWVFVALLLVVPVALIKAAADLGSTLDRLDAGWRRVRRRPPEPPGQPVQKIAADLHRLAVHIEQVDRSDLPAKAFRLRAATLAYDGVLLDAARTLQVPAPAEVPLQSLDRLQTEAALAQQGLVW